MRLIVGSFHSFAIPTLPAPARPYRIYQDFDTFIVQVVEEIFATKDDTMSWIEHSKIDQSYYHPILALKLVMLLSLASLELPRMSNPLDDLLLRDKNNIAYLLPKKFVNNLLRSEKDGYLLLNPNVVAEAFISIEDPLMVVTSDGSNPKVDAPSAIFVDLTKSKEEIMSVLFSKKGELSMNWEVFKEISEFIKEKKGESPSLLSVEATITVSVFVVFLVLSFIN